MYFNKDILVDLQKQVQFDFQAMRDSTQIPVIYQDLAHVIRTPGVETSVQAWLSEQPQYRKWVGPRRKNSLAAHTYELKNEPYELTVSCSSDDVKYKRWGQLSQRAQAAGADARVFWDRLIAAKLVLAKSELCWDGQPFYDTDHPVNVDDPSSTTFQNLWTTMPLNLDNFRTRYAYMAALKDAKGETYGARPTVLQCGPALEVTANEVVSAASVAKNVLQSTTVVGGVVVPNVQQGIVRVLVDDRITDSSWELHCTRGLIRPFIVQIETDPTPMVGKIAPTDDNVWNLREYEWGSELCGAVGYGLPQYSCRCEP